MAFNDECFTDEEINKLTKEILNDFGKNPDLDSNDDFMNWMNANIGNVHQISIPAPTPPPTCSTRTVATASTTSPPQVVLNAYIANDGYASNHSLPESLSLDIRNIKPAINGWSKYMSSIHSPSSKYIPYIAPPEIYTDDYSDTQLTHVSNVSSAQSTDILSPRNETPEHRNCDIPDFSEMHIDFTKKKRVKNSSDDFTKKKRAKRKHKRVSTPVIHRRTKQRLPLKSGSYSSPEMGAQKTYNDKHKKQCVLEKKVGNQHKQTSGSSLTLSSTSVHRKLSKRKGIRPYKKYSIRTVLL